MLFCFQVRRLYETERSITIKIRYKLEHSAKASKRQNASVPAALHCCQRCPSAQQLIVQWWRHHWRSPWWRPPRRRRVPAGRVPCTGSRTRTVRHGWPSCCPRDRTGSRSGPRKSDQSTAPPDIPAAPGIKTPSNTPKRPGFMGHTHRKKSTKTHPKLNPIFVSCSIDSESFYHGYVFETFKPTNMQVFRIFHTNQQIFQLFFCKSIKNISPFIFIWYGQ